MAKTIQSVYALLKKVEPELRAAFLASIRDITDSAVIGEIADAIQAGDIDKAVQAVGIEPAAFRPLTAAVESAYERGGIWTASQFAKPVGSAQVRFDVRNSRAEAWLRDYSSELVTNITSEQLGLVRSTIFDGMAAGTGPKNIALDLVGRYDPVAKQRTGGIVGLNRPQATALANAKRDLVELNENYFSRELRDKRFDGVVRKAIESGRPLTSDQIANISQRYSDNLLQWRGETIARDQTLTALNNSQQEALQQLLDKGNVEQRDVVREWDSAGNDGRTRQSHLDMDGQKVGATEPFITPDGAKLMFPGDYSLGAPPEETINCRCRVKLVIDFARKARESNQ